MHTRTVGMLGGLVLTALLAVGLGAQQDLDPAVQPVVRGILFYSPTCPHCREVMTETLPPVLEPYGDRIQIATVNTMSPGGQALYQAMVEHLALPRSRIGVPTLLIGDRALVGGIEIPTLLPEIADQALAETGIGWPDVPLIRQALADQGLLDTPSRTDVANADPKANEPPPEVAETPTESAGQAGPPGEATTPGPEPTDPAPMPAHGDEPVTGQVDESPPADEPATTGQAATADQPGADQPAAKPAVATEEGPDVEREPIAAVDLTSAFDSDSAVAHELGWRDRFLLDPVGNGIAVVVLLLMLGGLGLVVADDRGRIRIPRWPSWIVPTLVLLGAGIALYLTYVEATGAEAICGPVGHCNTVQQSPFARLFGVVPVAALGLVGYVLIALAWGLARGPGRLRNLGRTALWWLALGGVLFSLYLTFLEPFVIGASCAWCLSSAALMTLVLLAATGERHARADS